MENKNKKERHSVTERIVLSQESQAQLKKLCSQVAEDTKGLVQIPFRELANFLIQVRCAPITDEELGLLRAKYFDEVKALKWAMDQVKQARANGETVDLSELLKKVQMHGVAGSLTSKRPKKRRKALGLDAPHDAEIETFPRPLEGSMNPY